MTNRTPEIIPTADGYQVIHDGGIADVVHVPPKALEEAKRNRAVLNAVLARHGYRLAEPAAQKEGEAG